MSLDLERSGDLPRRRDDLAIAELTIKFQDFVDRYEREIELARIERLDLTAIIRSHDEFIREIKPMYSKGMIALGAFIIGSIGIATTWLWSHIRWG